MIDCPHGCGGIGTVSERNLTCKSCRRRSQSVEFIVPEDADTSEYAADGSGGDPMVARKASWCWAWWGSPDHRMRCRRQAGHEPADAHDTHEDGDPMSGCISVSTTGKRVR
jgi:hypothetical protein